MTATYMLAATIASIEMVTMLFAWAYLALLVFPGLGRKPQESVRWTARRWLYALLWLVAAIVTTVHFFGSVHA